MVRFNKAKAGKVFESEVREGLKLFAIQHSRDFWWQRLYDHADYVKVNPLIQQPKQSADFHYLYRGHYGIIECKSTHVDRFMFDYLKPYQRQSHQDITYAGGTGLILISLRKERPVICVAMDYLTYLKCEADYLKVNPEAKSMPRSHVEGYGKKLAKVRGGGWILDPVLNKEV